MSLVVEREIADGISFYRGTLPPPSPDSVNWGFLVHPLKTSDFNQFNPKLARWTSKPGFQNSFMYRAALKALELQVVGHATVRVGRRVSHGVFVLIPRLPVDFGDRSQRDEIIDLQVRGTQIAHNFGASVVGMGAFNSIGSNNGADLDGNPDVPTALTSGSAGTGSGAKRGVLEACKLLGIIPRKSTLVLVGATGAVGRATSALLGRRFGKVILVARDEARLRKLSRELIASGVEAAKLEVSTNLNEACSRGDVLVFATNVSDARDLELDPRAVQPGTLVDDLGRPLNITEEFIKARPDVLCIEGAVFELPGENTFSKHLQMGTSMVEGRFHAYGCLTETICMALRGRMVSQSIGPRLDIATVSETDRLIGRYKFGLAGFRMFDRPTELEHIELVRAARMARRFEAVRAARITRQPRLSLNFSSPRLQPT